MRIENCRVCNSTTRRIFEGELLRRKVGYFECDLCGYVQTEFPNWLDEAYKDPINLSDTNILNRNSKNANKVITALLLMKKISSTVVDFAGGYGLLVRMLRDKGINAYWSDQYCENFFAKRFEWVGQRVGLATAFEALEHFLDPVDELKKILSVSDAVLVSTELIQMPTPKLADWGYYGLDHGQHIGFFRERTIEHMAKQLGVYGVSDGKYFHMFSKRKVHPFVFKWGLKGSVLIAKFAAPFLKSKTIADSQACK